MRSAVRTLTILLALGAPLLPTAASAAPPAKPVKVGDALTGDAKVAFNEARLLFTKQEYAAAREQYMRAYTLGKEPRVLYNVAVCFKEEGKYASAVRVLQESADLAKDAPRDYLERVTDTIDTLMALVATVTIDGLEPGMTVDVDRETVPVSAQGKLLVDAGTRTLVVRRPGFTPQSFTREFPAGERFGFRVSLTPLPGKIRVSADGVPNASVLLDGREVGLAPVTLSVAPGSHEILVRAPGFREARRTVDAASDAESAIALALDRDVRTARLRVTAGPRDAIAVDGKASGVGSFDGLVLAGEHRVTIARAEGGSEVLEIALREDEVRDMRIAPEAKRGGGIPVWIWVVGGAVALAGGGTAVYFATRPTQYDGSTPGTLDPKVIPTRFPGGIR